MLTDRRSLLTVLALVRSRYVLRSKSATLSLASIKCFVALDAAASL